MPTIRYPCRNCVYFDGCGDSSRTEPCAGRMTRRQAREASGGSCHDCAAVLSCEDAHGKKMGFCRDGFVPSWSYINFLVQTRRIDGTTLLRLEHNLHAYEENQRLLRCSGNKNAFLLGK